MKISKIAVGIVTLLFTKITFAQDSCLNVKINKIDLNISQNIGLGNTKNTGLKWLSKPAIQTQKIWVTGLNGTTPFSISTDVFNNQSDFCLGPISNSCNQHYSNNEIPIFNSITDSIINDHKNNYKKTNYKLPLVLKNWPANGKTGYSNILTGFSDKNTNSIYEPLTGEYPIVLGNISTTLINSDSAGKTKFKTTATCVDVVSQWFGFQKDTLAALKNTVFLRNTVCNRGSSNLTDVKISLVNDFAIGETNNNFVQTAADLGALVGYNGEPSDAVFGSKWPYVSVVCLNPKAQHSIYFDSSTVNQVSGRPTKTKHFYNLARAIWKTDSVMTYGNTGRDRGARSNFVYSNGSDTNFKTRRIWVENGNNQFGQRTALISTYGVDLNAGACKVFDAAIVISENAGDSLIFRKDIQKVQDYYFKSSFVLNTNKAKNKINKTSIFPNPIRPFDKLQLIGFYENKSIDIYDLAGRKIKSNLNLNWEGFNAWPLGTGIFIINQNSISQKLLVY